MAFEFKFPDVGEGITEGEIVKWLIKEGDSVKQDQEIAEVETDKAIVKLPSPKAGKILKLHAKEGEVIKVGQTIVTIGESGEQATKSEPPPSRKSIGVVGEIPETSETLPLPVQRSAQSASTKKILATPAIRKMAEDLGVDITQVQGSGPEGRITEADLKGHTGAKVVTPTVQKKYDIYGYIDRVPLKGVRRAISNRLTKSAFTAVHVTHMDEADVTSLWSHREKEKKFAEEKGVHLTFMPFIVKACIQALKGHPYLNSSIDESTEDIVIKKYYNIGIAVDTEDGLMVPVVKIADQKSILDIAKEISDLSEKAKKRTVDLGDMKGGTFTITNVGSTGGGIFATPIINYPECAILALGRIKDAPVAKEGMMTIRKVLPLSMTFDHRIVDGAEAARFANDLKILLEDPDRLLLE